MKKKKILKVTLYFILGIGILIILTDPFCFWWYCYPDNSKRNATKSIHAQTVKYISAEIQGCALGDTTMMKGNLICSELNAANVVDAAAKTLTNHLITYSIEYKNPYSTKNNAVRISTSSTKDKDAGYINLSASGSDVVVKSCHTKPCSDEDNRKSETIEIK